MMLFNPEKVSPLGLDILKRDSYTMWRDNHILFVQPSKPLKFEDAQTLFSMGWKMQDGIWFYNLIQAYMLGERNGEK